jgi:hypothetical protein
VRASVTAQRIRVPCLDACPRIALTSELLGLVEDPQVATAITLTSAVRDSMTEQRVLMVDHVNRIGVTAR